MLFAVGFFLVSFVVLAVGIVYERWPNRQRTYPIGTIASILAIAGALALVVSLANYYWVAGLLRGLAREIGAPQELASALTLFVTGVLSYFVSKMVSLRSGERFKGNMGFAVMVAAYFLTLLAGTYGDSFAVDGSSKKCVYFDENGVREYDGQQNDRMTGKPCIMLTPENADWLGPIVARGNGAPERKFDEPFFAARANVDGPVALAWFSRKATGEIELWDRAGIHPRLGTRLTVVTPEIVREWDEQRRSGRAPATLLQPSGSVPKGAPKQSSAAEQAEAAVEDLRIRYLVPSAKSVSGSGANTKWAVVAWSAEGGLEPRLGSEIVSAARSSGLPPPNALFSANFTQDMSAEKLLNGDTSQVAQMGLARYVDYVALARSEKKRQPDRGPETLKAVDYNIKVIFVRASDLSSSSPIFVADGASGFDYGVAEERAVDATLEKLRATLAPSMKGFIK